MVMNSMITDKSIKCITCCVIFIMGLLLCSCSNDQQAGQSQENSLAQQAAIMQERMVDSAAKGDLQATMKYATRYAQICDSLQSGKTDDGLSNPSSKEISEPSPLYTEDQLRLIISILLLALLVLCLLGLFFHHNFYRQRNLQRLSLERRNTQFQQLYTTYDKARHDYEALQGNFEQYKQEKNRELEQLQQQIEEFMEQDVSVETWDKERVMFKDQAIAKLHDMLQRGKIPSGRDIREVVKLAEEHLPTFWATICDPTKHLSQTEIQVCTLLRTCFIPSEIAAIMNISLQRVSNVKASINEKLYGIKGAKGLEDRLLSLH